MMPSNLRSKRLTAARCDDQVLNPDELGSKRGSKMTDGPKLVFEQDPKVVAAQRARTEIAAATKELAANLLRIIAGAGNSEKLVDQMTAALKPCEKLCEASGSATSLAGALDEALRDLDWRQDATGYSQPTDEDRARWERDGTTETERARDAVVQAALRLVAAQLSAQPTQESQADNQLLLAIRYFGRAWAEHRAKISQ